MRTFQFERVAKSVVVPSGLHPELEDQGPSAVLAGGRPLRISFPFRKVLIANFCVFRDTSDGVHFYVVLVTSNCSHRTVVKLRNPEFNNYRTASITQSDRYINNRCHRRTSQGLPVILSGTWVR